MSRGLALPRWIVTGLSACLLAAGVWLPGALKSQELDYDPEWFDCGSVRRDGTLLVLNDGSNPGVPVAYLSCTKNTCVNRYQTTAGDGTAREVFQHIYFPDGGQSYVSTFTRWKADAETPEWHFVRRSSLYGCITVTEDEDLWTLDVGTIRYEDGAMHAIPLTDDRASYFYAPTRLLGDWTDATAITFEKQSSGGRYLSGFHGGIYGDVVLKNGSMRASYEIAEHHVGEWRQFRVALDDPAWRLQGGATSVAAVLAHVTRFQIRAEYGYDDDVASIRNVVIE